MKGRPSCGWLSSENATDNVDALNPQKELPMKCDKYIGMDVHRATTVVVVLDATGKLILETIIATEAAAIVRLLQGINGPLHVTFEESTQAGWLYDVVRGFVAEAIVCALSGSVPIAAALGTS